jgi:hypothetical protein
VRKVRGAGFEPARQFVQLEPEIELASNEILTKVDATKTSKRSFKLTICAAFVDESRAECETIT